ncbi:hypothetical protein F66182_7107 [Fusarium sp. NRRL 66182]|nr:hypothetical protein F66182_7107 [Fusarium sp. NRRL 66182]
MASSDHIELMPLETIENLSGKFNIWCGNLKAAQTGLDSLESILQKEAVLEITVVKVLHELDHELRESISVVSRDRLPYEEQARPAELSEDESSDESGSEDTSSPKTELSMRLGSIIDLLDKLYTLGFHIRGADLDVSPAPHQQTYSKPEADAAKDESLGYEKDVADHLALLRQGRTAPHGPRDNLPKRLAASIGLRRKHIESRRNRARPENPVHESVDLQVSHQTYPESSNQEPFTPRDDDQDLHLQMNVVDTDNEQEADSSTFEAIEFPEPPLTPGDGSGFICPYCVEHCQHETGRGNVWKAHVLDDIQPYVCTYDNCPRPPTLFKSKAHWIKHEAAVHRQHWRCPQHPLVFYASADGLKAHLSLSHSGTYTGRQIDDLVDLWTFEMAEDRELCPICLQKGPFSMNLTDHLANHLEELALSSLPSEEEPGISEDEDSVLEQLAALFDESAVVGGSSAELPPTYGNTSSDQELIDVSHLAELCQAETKRAHVISKNLPSVHVPAVAETERTIRATADLLRSVKLHLRETVTLINSTWYSTAIGPSLMFIFKCLGWVWRMICIPFTRHYSIQELFWIQIYEDIVPGVTLPEVFQHCSNILRQIDKFFTTTPADEEWILWKMSSTLNDLAALMGPSDGSAIEPSPDLWDKFRSTITHFHCDRSLSLSESMQSMQIEYGFYASRDTFMAYWWRWAFKFDFPSGYRPKWRELNEKASQSLESRVKRAPSEPPERHWLNGIVIPKPDLTTYYSLLGNTGQTMVNAPLKPWIQVVRSSSTSRILKTASLDHGRVMLFVLEDVNSPPLVMLRKKESNGQAGGACQASLKDIEMSHVGDTLFLYMDDNGSKRVWAQLCFETYEELKLMHYSLALLKPQNLAFAEIDPGTGHLHGDETEIFAADLEGFRKLGVFVDTTTGIVLFEATRKVFKTNDYRPCWAFIGTMMLFISGDKLLTLGQEKPEEAFSLGLTVDGSNHVRVYNTTSFDFESSRNSKKMYLEQQGIHFADREKAIDFINLFSSQDVEETFEGNSKAEDRELSGPRVAEEPWDDSGKGKGRAD